MDKRIWKPLAMTLAVSAASLSHAYADVDIDNDGLIEISTLQELDLMRYDLAGTSLNGDSTGCPATGCNGYELVADLDFDTNGNGVADAGDLFWNNGQGWEPVGDTDGGPAYAQKKTTGAFGGIFNGNGFQLSNMYIDRPNDAWVGLFANTYHSSVSDVVFNGALINGEDATGVLSGGLNDTEVSRVRIKSSLVSGVNEVGLLAGRVFGVGTTISNINVEGSISANHFAGGTVGWFNADAYQYGINKLYLSDIISKVDVQAQDNTGCIVGQGRGVIASNLVSICETVTGRNYVGASFGGLLEGEINNAVMKGNIDGASYVGGIVGILNGSVLTKARAVSGTVSGRYPAGLVGHVVNSTVSDAASSVEVNGYWAASGAFNQVQFDVNILNVYSTSSLYTTRNDPNNKVGLIRDVYYSSTTVNLSDSYWDADTTGTSYSAGGYGEAKSTAELQCPTMPGDVSCDASMYSGWDDTIWDFATSSDYPVLR
jgi:hypothetical protein